MIQTHRLVLHHWQDDHRLAFARMHTDPEVMLDLGGPIDDAASNAKFDRYCLAYLEHGISRWAVEADGVFVGYAGVMPRLSVDHPLGSHYEVGWRLTRKSWGRGYATESAGAALAHAFTQCGLKEIFSYTSPDNLRSQAVMGRLKLQRDASRDFAAQYEGAGLWRGLVWVTRSFAVDRQN